MILPRYPCMLLRSTPLLVSFSFMRASDILKNHLVYVFSNGSGKLTSLFCRFAPPTLCIARSQRHSTKVCSLHFDSLTHTGSASELRRWDPFSVSAMSVVRRLRPRWTACSIAAMRTSNPRVFGRRRELTKRTVAEPSMTQSITAMWTLMRIRIEGLRSCLKIYLMSMKAT